MVIATLGVFRSPFDREGPGIVTVWKRAAAYEGVLATELDAEAALAGWTLPCFFL